MNTLARAFAASLSWFICALLPSAKRKPFVSLVALLPERHPMGSGDLDAAMERAGIQSSVVAGEAPVFIVTVGAIGILVTVKNEPYNKQENVPEDVPPALKQMVLDHRAAILVDLISGAEDEVDFDAAYQVIGPLLAELAPIGCVVFWPDKTRFARFDGTAKTHLHSSAPLLAFAGGERADIIETELTDARLEQAEKEARAKWAEFETSFEKKTWLQQFLVKAYFTYGGRKEAMWVTPKSIDGQTISGTLENEPNEVLNLMKGDDVSFNLEAVSDWTYDGKGETRGGFTTSLLEEQAD